MQLTLPESNRKPILRWLVVCLALVSLMVVVGGLTRLTESGLSMVEWKPTTILPPLNDQQWLEEFSKYQQSPEYQKVNKGFGVEGFKQIFWLEYIHRLLGRLIGAVFFFPFAYFLARRMIPFPLTWRLAGIFLLGGMQGCIGWYMVRSGLVDQPWVSPVRLMLHLGMAFLLFGMLWWQILKLQYHDSPLPHRKPFLWIGLLIALYLQILMGALVAGMDAGLLFNTFPTMAGEWVPAGIWLLDPWYLNLFENGTTVHFLHRLGALIVTVALVLAVFQTLHSQKHATVRENAKLIFAALIAQIVLGILTVVYAVPIAIATAHQGAALLLMAAVIRQFFLSQRT
jgi:cytochrome c oxidase assembly protein subunit 15